MEHAHDGASLVPYRLPRRLSGTSSYASTPYEMAWSDPALPQSVSPASSASQSSSSSSSSQYASNRADRGYDFEASPSFDQPRYPSDPYCRPQSGPEMEVGFTTRFQPAESSLPDYEDSRTVALPRYTTLRPDEGLAAYESRPAGAHTHSSAPSHFYSVLRPERNNITGPRFNPYPQPRSRHSDSVSVAGSDYGHGSPAPSNAETESSSSGSQQYGRPTSLPTSMPVDIVPRTKNRKQRLYTVDRQKICRFALDNPTLRQEQIAKQFNVERSTVSKILKAKERWLNASPEPKAMAAKERQAKFGELENRMRVWVREQDEAKTVFTDAMIRNKALELARDCSDTNTRDKFKASPGWIENFKARMGIRKGRYYGDGKDVQRKDARDCLKDGDAPGRRWRVDIPKGLRDRPPEGKIPTTMGDMTEAYDMDDTRRSDGGEGDSGEDPDRQDTTDMHRNELVEQHMPSTRLSFSANVPVPPDSSTMHAEEFDEPYVVSDLHEAHPVHSDYSQSSEPNYIEAMLHIATLCRTEAFKKYAEITDEEDDCITNIARAIPLYLRGLPYNRT